MRIPFLALRLASCAAVAAACSHAAPSTGAAPAPQPAPAGAQAAPGQLDLTGDWAVQVLPQGQSPSTGLMKLTPSGANYRGNVQFDAANRPYFVRSATAADNHIVIILDTPDGDARIEGNMRGPTQFDGLYSSRTLNGRCTMSRR